MKQIRTVQRIMTGIACLGLLMPAQIMAAQPLESTDRAMPTHDVLLHGGDVLAGQVVDPQGQPRSAVPVSLQHKGYEVARVSTDENGYFAVRGVRTGIYTVQSDNTAGLYRAWPITIAPPAAKPGALLVTHTEVVRGQCDQGQCGCDGPCSGHGGVLGGHGGHGGVLGGHYGHAGVLGNECGHAGGLGGGGGLFGSGFGLSAPLVIGGVLATAIAVPLAVQNESSPGS